MVFALYDFHETLNIHDLKSRQHPQESPAERNGLGFQVLRRQEEARG